MLLTLLPLVGWAEAPTVLLSKTQYTYIGGSMETAVRAKLTITGTYDEVRFYEALAGPSAPEATTSGVTPINAGGYYVRAAYAGEWSEAVYFEIKPKDLSLTATQIEIRYGEYGADLPDGYYTVDGFVGSDDEYSVHIAGVKASSAAATAANGAADSYPYNLSISGATTGNPNYSLKVIGTGSTLTISKLPITISPVAASKTYGGENPDFTGTITYPDGFVVPTSNTYFASPVYTVGRTSNSQDAGTYTGDLTVTLGNDAANNNYNITYDATADFTIYKALVDEEKASAVLADPTATLVYNTQAQSPAITVSYDGTELTSGYAIAYSNNINAGNTATATVTFKNYYKDDIDVAYTKDVVFTINKKSLGDANGAAEGITARLASTATAWVYDGTEQNYGTGLTKVSYKVDENTTVNLVKTTDYTRTKQGDFVNATASVDDANKPYYVFTGNGNYEGFVKLAVNIAKADLNAKVTSQNITFGTDVPANAIEYANDGSIQGTDVFADVVDVTNVAYAYKQGANVVENPVNAGTYDITATGATADNYNVIIASGTLKINPVTVYIKPVAQSKFYGQADPNFAQPTTAMYELVDGEGNAVEGAVLNGTVALGRKAGETVGNYDIYVKSYTANLEVADNYSPSNTYYTNDENLGSHTATFTINAQEAKLILKFKEGTPATKVYGEDTYAYSVNDLEVVSGLAGSDTWETLKVGATFTPALESENVHFDGNKVTATITGLANYPNIEVQPLAFTVTKRKFGVKPSAQTKDYGAAISTAKTYWAKAAASSYAPGESKDDVLVELYTVEDVATFAPGSVNEGVIKARIADESNYELDEENSVWGTLTINDVNEETVLAMRSVYTDADDDEFTKIQAYDGKTVKVKLTVNRTQTLPSSGKTYTWNAEDWNAFILPFDITPKQLSEAFGYAIVNVVNPDATKDGNIAFKLQMSGTIPANTPFMLKNYEAVEPDAEITLGSFEIVAPENEEVSVDAGEGWKFIGGYKTWTIDYENTDVYYYNGMGAWKHLGASSSNTWNIAPFNAYLLQPAAGADNLAREITFTFEELDGSATVIKSVSEESTDTVLEGWYTINGIKLESAPTQKGIYIKDGKKVVIK